MTDPAPKSLDLGGGKWSNLDLPKHTVVAYSRNISRKKEVAKMVTRSSRSWKVRKERLRWLGRMVPGVHISDDKINRLVPMSIVVNKLP